ncbi:MAG TPA: CDP-alcohol phosphatidyltransferase family protein [Myxococcota bacterium]|nr:CDP-alcohol phosphatidyltransferase family protein [Myxococcota bacterium]
MLRHFLNPPNWFTAASIFCSTTAMALLMSHPELDHTTLSRACILVVFGGIFDNLDGRVARLTRRQSDFGVQLDSIADILGFGLTPAMIAWAWKLHTLGWGGIAVTFWYVVCAAFRLARFNVNVQSEVWPFPGHSQGLTSTMSGGMLVTLMWVASGVLGDRLHVTPAVLSAVVVLLGYLMVSAVPFRTFKNARQSRIARALLVLGMASCVLGAIAFGDMAMFFGVGAVVYLSVGVIEGVGLAALHGRLSQALLLTDDGAPDDDEERATAGR